MRKLHSQLRPLPLNLVEREIIINVFILTINFLSQLNILLLVSSVIKQKLSAEKKINYESISPDFKNRMQKISRPTQCSWSRTFRKMNIVVIVGYFYIFWMIIFVSLVLNFIDLQSSELCVIWIVLDNINKIWLFYTKNNKNKNIYLHLIQINVHFLLKFTSQVIFFFV